MEIFCLISTLENGEFSLPFVNRNQFADSIEALTGILSCSQVYYRHGEKFNLSSFSPEINSLQVVQSESPASRFYIETPTKNFRVNIRDPSKKCLKDLLIAITIKGNSLGTPYPNGSFSLYHNNIIIPFETNLNDIPHDLILTLKEIPTYPIYEFVKIYVRKLSGEIYEIVADPNDLIDNVKILVYHSSDHIPDEQRLMYEGKQLEDNKTLAYYHISNESTLHLVLRLRGGGGPHVFCFNEMMNQVKIEFSDNAPEWRTVKQGISWIGICGNSNCRAFRKQVICNSGFGVFDANIAKRQTLCPVCNQIVSDVQNCGFFMAKWKFVGRDSLGVERRGNGEALENKYTSFRSGDDQDWAILRIEVVPCRNYYGF